MKYSVMRYRRLIGVFTFDELKEWMLNNLPAEYHAEIQQATVGYSEHCENYDDTSKPMSLNWLAICSEYCSIKEVNE